MSRIVILADTHFGCRNDSGVFLDFQEKFYKETFFPFLDENDIKTVVHLGDSFDRRKFVNFGTLHRTKKFYFDELAKREINCPVIIGNHDTFYKDTNKVNSIELLTGEYPNIDMIVSPRTIDIEGFPICMIPWICDDNQEDCFNEIETAKTDLCMGHFAFAGFVMHQGQVAESGLERQVVSKFDMVFSGHYHHRSSDGLVHYLGNPHEMTWQDFDDPKGFHTFDLATRDLKFIANPNKMFHKVTYNEDHVPEWQNYNGVYVKVVVEKRTNIKKFEKFMEKIYDMNPVNINVVENFVDVIELPEMVVNQANDTPTLLENFIDGTNVPPDIKKDQLKDIFREIYNDSLVMEE